MKKIFHLLALLLFALLLKPAPVSGQPASLDITFTPSQAYCGDNNENRVTFYPSGLLDCIIYDADGNCTEDIYYEIGIDCEFIDGFFSDEVNIRYPVTTFWTPPDPGPITRTFDIDGDCYSLGYITVESGEYNVCIVGRQSDGDYYEHIFADSYITFLPSGTVPTPTPTPADECGSGYHCSMPDVLCSDTNSDEDELDLLSREQCQTACINSNGAWTADDPCSLNYYPLGEEYHDGYCCIPNDVPEGWNEWECSLTSLGYCATDTSYVCDEADRDFYDIICDVFNASDHPYCENDDTPLTGLSHGYCSTSNPDNCYQCQFGGTCELIENPYENVCDPTWRLYSSEDECIQACSNGYKCTENGCETAEDDYTGTRYTYLSQCEDMCLGCTGIFSDTRGACFYLQCPPDYYFEGINPPHEETGCPLLFSCCTQPGEDWIIRNTLNPRCITSRGRMGIRTAIGCIGVTSQTDLLLFVLPWAIGVGGGTAFILIIVAGFLIMTSGGDPRRAKAGKELLGAAIAGLLMIIFSVYILDIIGIRILRIPGM